MRTRRFDLPENFSRLRIDLQQPPRRPARGSGDRCLVRPLHSRIEHSSDVAKRIRLAHMRPLSEEFPLQIEPLDTVISAIRHEQRVPPVERYAMWRIELTGRGAVFPPLVHALTLRVVFQNSRI